MRGGAAAQLADVAQRRGTQERAGQRRRRRVAIVARGSWHLCTQQWSLVWAWSVGDAAGHVCMRTSYTSYSCPLHRTLLSWYKY